MKFMIRVFLSLGLCLSTCFIAIGAPHGASNQKVSGSVQGLGFPTIEVGVNGRGVIIDLGDESKLQKLGLTESLLEIGTYVEAMGQITKGKFQDKLEATSIKIGDKEFKLK